MAVGLVEILDPGRYYPVYSLLLSLLDSLSIIRLRRTCKAFCSGVGDLRSREWNVDRLLCRFVAKPLALREVMRDHGAVISGSVALQFFERTCWKESDLDLFVVGEDGAVALGQHLETREGYKASAPEPTSDHRRRYPGSSRLKVCCCFSQTALWCKC